MGKLVTYIVILIIIDLLFITTGQICNEEIGCSLNSIIFNSILNLDNVNSLDFFREIIGNIGDLFNSTTGIASLLITASAVFIGSVLVPGEIRFFIPVTLSLALLISDFVFIASYLGSQNKILATFIMAPLIILYILTVVEWLRGKD